MDKNGLGPFCGSIVLALGTMIFNFMQVSAQNTFFAIFQTITLVLFLVTVIYTFSETQSRSLYRRLSWAAIICVFSFNVVVSFIYNA